MRRTTGHETQPQPGTSFARAFHARRGTGEQAFSLRLSRARLLHLRRRDIAANWLALTISLALYLLFTGSPAHANPTDGVLAEEVSLAKHVFVAAHRRVARERAAESKVYSVANEVM